MSKYEDVQRFMGHAGEALPESDPVKRYANHLAAHSVLAVMGGDHALALNLNAPCPYCGALPPGMAFPRQSKPQ